MYIVFCWFAVLLRFAVNKLIAMELLFELIAVYVLWQCINKYLLAHTHWAQLQRDGKGHLCDYMDRLC